MGSNDVGGSTNLSDATMIEAPPCERKRAGFSCAAGWKPAQR
jgi:hypothetical protein